MRSGSEKSRTVARTAPEPHPEPDEYGRRGGQSLTERLRERGKPLVMTEVFNLTDGARVSKRQFVGRVAEDVVQLLTTWNPMAITRDWELKEVPGLPLAERWTDRVRRFLAD